MIVCVWLYCGRTENVYVNTALLYLTLMTLATLPPSLSLSLSLSRHQAKGHWTALRKRMGNKVEGSAKNRAEGTKHSVWSKRLGTKKKTKIQSHLTSVLGRKEEIKGRDLRRIERQINKIKASCLVALLEDLPFAVLNFFILRVATQLTSTIITVRMNISRQFRTRVSIVLIGLALHVLQAYSSSYASLCGGVVLPHVL